MMKSLLISFVVVVAAGSTVAAQAVAGAPAQAKTMKSMDDHHAASSGWKELDAFHTVMAATWHPASKSNDLKVIREKAPDLSQAAQKWAASKVPAGCDTKPIRDAIAAVVTGSKDVAALVAKQAPDADVKAALRDVHDRFEVVEQGCQPSHGAHKP
jgi:hypothetical protein